MGIHDYITQGSGGTVVLNCNSVPDYGFIDAIKTKEIVKIKILSREEKAHMSNYKAGCPDILTKSYTGEKGCITRKQLVESYMHTNGKKIKLAILKSNNTYTVYRNCNEPYKVLKLPSNCSGKFNNSNVSSGSFIVCKCNSDGTIDRNSMYIVSRKMFKKMFRVPMQKVLKRNISNGTNSGTFKLFRKDAIRRHSTPINRDINLNIGDNNVSNTNNVDMPNVNRVNIPNMNNTANTNRIQTQNTNKFSGNRGVNTFRNKQNNNKVGNYSIRVINRVTDMNGDLLGYTLQEISTGKTRIVRPQQLMVLCSKKVVENIMLVQRENGTTFLKGNGIVLESLPSIIN